MTAITLKVLSVACTDATADDDIATALNTVTINHVYGTICIPLSNTQWRIIMTYD